jgi:putative ABC transport system permease protein
VRGTHAFSGFGAYRASTYEFSGPGNPVQISAARLTAGTFPTLRVSPILGCVFTQQEETNGAPAAVLSYQTWRSRFNADPQILHRKILLDRKPYQVTGVMPRDFEFPLVPGRLNRCELWVPMNFTQSERSMGLATGATILSDV